MGSGRASSAQPSALGGPPGEKYRRFQRSSSRIVAGLLESGAWSMAVGALIGDDQLPVTLCRLFSTAIKDGSADQGANLPARLPLEWNLLSDGRRARMFMGRCFVVRAVCTSPVRELARRHRCNRESFHWPFIWAWGLFVAETRCPCRNTIRMLSASFLRCFGRNAIGLCGWHWRRASHLGRGGHACRRVIFEQQMAGRASTISCASRIPSSFLGRLPEGKAPTGRSGG